MKTSADQPHAPARRLRTTPEHGAASASPSCQEHFSPEREVPNQKEFSIRGFSQKKTLSVERTESGPFREPQEIFVASGPRGVYVSIRDCDVLRPGQDRTENAALSSARKKESPAVRSAASCSPSAKEPAGIPPPVPAGGSFRQPEPYFDSYGVITWNTASGPSSRAPPLP